MRRVFTQNNDKNFNDYYSKINNETILKNALTHGIYYKNNYLIIKNNEITNFSNYNNFLGISKAFYRRYLNNKIIKSPITVYEGKLSTVCDHKRYTTDCYNCNYNCMCNFDCSYNYNCNENIYPHGIYENKNDKFIFLSKLLFPINKNSCNNLCIEPQIKLCDNICYSCEKKNKLFI
jgi:hypothetical protein